mmetsp:Transcript_2955/g.7397  ORF Transcript_2955/g.7397 Transcript_2955/m.7397 type:complete len:92 (+) Transcript_2955:548-823(+)
MGCMSADFRSFLPGQLAQPQKESRHFSLCATNASAGPAAPPRGLREASAHDAKRHAKKKKADNAREREPSAAFAMGWFPSGGCAGGCRCEP